jgi:ribosomal protein S18 acetylase RimI-like enzyme
VSPFLSSVSASETHAFSPTTVLYNDVPVGNVCCHLRRSENGETSLYIATLGILAPYRRQGLATRLFEHVLSAALSPPVPPLPPAFNPKPAATTTTPNTKGKEKEGKKDETPKIIPRPERLELHVQTSNEDALAFWKEREFEVKGEPLQDYYKRLEPKTAFVLERRLK